jgi:hypothetical protein
MDFACLQSLKRGNINVKINKKFIYRMPKKELAKQCLQRHLPGQGQQPGNSAKTSFPESPGY